ncbi:MAG: ribonuclease Z [Candidatus Syntrophosphaera sp.]|nr:ribonuclease Z [Candidatus Syntrophosphaera sp.]
MRFILLGTGSGLPEQGSHLSSLYVNSEGKHLLFDCGEGTSWQLLRHGLAGDVLDAIFISHYHPDHVSGLFMVLQMLYLQKRQKPLQLFLPERPGGMMETFQFFYTFPQRFPFPLQILDCREAELHHDDVTIALTDHLRGYEEFIAASQLANQMNSYAFRISSPAGDLAYTSDIATTDCIQLFLRDCHTVIVDALHPEPAQIFKLSYAGITRILLTHGISESLQAQLAENPQELMQPALEDNIYSIP